MRTIKLVQLFAIITAAAFVGCGDDPDENGDGGDVAADGEDDIDTYVDPWAGPPETGDWRVLYGYRGRQPSNQDQNELWLMDSNGNSKLALTDLSGLKNLDPPLSCNYGCVVSPDLKWIAVVTGPPTATGFEIRLGKFNANYEVVLLKGAALTDIIDFKFSGDRIFYSKQKVCEGAVCEYDFFVVELSDNVNAAIPIFSFPPAADKAGSTFRGHFRASSDGKKLVVLNPTIRSVGVFMWKDGSGLIELDFICKFGTKDDCSGTGSEYTDTDPAAISPDGRWIVFFTFSDRWQRARLYDTENPGDIQLSIMASVPTGSYIEKACDPGVLEDWQWQRVVGTPQFTPDSDSIVFLTNTGCTDDGSQPVKPRTNLRRIKVDALRTGATIASDDVLNLTNHPFGDLTANKRTTAFFISPDGGSVVFTASPIETQSGQPIGDGTARQRNDREVFRMALDGSNVQQLTNDLAWSAESPTLIPGTD